MGEGVAGQQGGTEGSAVGGEGAVDGKGAGKPVVGVAEGAFLPASAYGVAYYAAAGGFAPPPPPPPSRYEPQSQASSSAPRHHRGGSSPGGYSGSSGGSYRGGGGRSESREVWSASKPRPRAGYSCKICGTPGGLPDSHWFQLCPKAIPQQQAAMGHVAHTQQLQQPPPPPPPQLQPMQPMQPMHMPMQHPFGDGGGGRHGGTRQHHSGSAGGERAGGERGKTSFQPPRAGCK